MWKGYEAIPSYFGGKRKLARRILSHAKGEVFIDAFLGGGSVSLLAKAKGMKVICNDISERSRIVGKAIIENKGKKLTDYDLYSLFNETENKFIRDHFPNLALEKDIQFLDDAFANAKTDLQKLLLIKFLFKYKPFSMLSNKVPTDLNDCNLKVIQPHLKYMFKPIRTLKKIKEQINYGIFDNGKDCEFHNKDVFEFLDTVQGDTVYFDPPYAGSQSYEEFYYILDSILYQKKEPLKKSKFNSDDYEDFLHKLMEKSMHIPRVIFSFGGPKVDGKRLLEIVQQHRPAKLYEIQHKWSITATKESMQTATEILVVTI
jgi:adenine-specific DNA methylase